MKVTLSTLENSVADYVNREMVGKLNDWRKWVLPVAVDTMYPVVNSYFDKYKDMLKKTEFVDDSDMIDIELLYDKFHNAALDNGDIIQTIPIIGEVKFTARDIESLYRIIQDKGGVTSFYDKGVRK